MLKKVVVAFFNGGKQKARFLLSFVFRGVETTPLQNGASSMRRTGCCSTPCLGLRSLAFVAQAA
jgi:hypothetical protein